MLRLSSPALSDIGNGNGSNNNLEGERGEMKEEAGNGRVPPGILHPLRSSSGELKGLSTPEKVVVEGVSEVSQSDSLSLSEECSTCI